MFFIKYKKYTNEEIQNIISEYGFNLIEYNNVKNIIGIDNEGYKYKITLYNLLDNKIPNKWMKNPYATENVRLYLQNNYPDYIWLGDAYKGCKAKEKFICLKHVEYGIQENTFDNIINNNHVCNYCGYERLGKIKQIDESTLINLCKEKNVEYIGRFIKNHESYIQYICHNHNSCGIQEMSLTHFRASKIPCRFCNITSGELKIQNYLLSKNILFETQKVFSDCRDIKPLRFDFYLTQKNICIEYDGQQHYFPINFNNAIDNGYSNFINTQRKDNIKNKYCKDNGIKLIRIPYWEYENIEKIISVEI